MQTSNFKHKQPEIKPIQLKDLNIPQKIHLRNNIPVYSLNIGSQDVLRMDICIYAGSAFQDKSLAATSVMKMIAEGTKNYSSAQISELFDYYGAYYDNEIGKDLVSFKFYSLTKHFKQLIPAIAEMFFEPVFSQKEFETYVGRSKQKFLINQNKAKFIARQQFSQMLFGSNHPYGSTAMEEDFEKINIEDVKDFHSKYYQPSNMFILIVGKVTDEVLKILDKLLGQQNIKNVNSKDISQLPFEEITNRKRFIERKNSVQNAFRIGKRMFNMQKDDYQGLKVLNTALGGYFGSRLMRNIREDKGYTYGIGSALIPLHHSGYFFIASEVGTEVCTKALAEVYFEIEELQQTKIKESELELVKNYMLGNYLRAIDGPFEVLERIKTLIEHDLPANYFSEYMKTIKDIDAERLLALAQKHFDKDTLIELVVGRNI